MNVQARVIAQYQARYIQNYLEGLDTIPDEIVPHLSRTKELDYTVRGE